MIEEIRRRLAHMQGVEVVQTGERTVSVRLTYAMSDVVEARERALYDAAGMTVALRGIAFPEVPYGVVGRGDHCLLEQVFETRESMPLAAVVSDDE